ncbi:MAG: hypothetical protein HYX26_03845 [Acidobacteriales bacterium]|nr:hypothetical protein [Terriglobales bacterium]
MNELNIFLSALNFLYQIYKDRRDRRPSSTAPSPEKLQEVIAKTRDGAFSKERLETAIDVAFSSSEAAEVKADLRIVTIIASPISVQELDYWTVVDETLQRLGSIAHYTKTFKARGISGAEGTWEIELKVLAKLLSEYPEIKSGTILSRSRVYFERRIINIRCWLQFDEKKHVSKLLLLIGAVFLESDHVGGSSAHNAIQLYSLEEGNQSNWLRFSPRTAETLISQFEHRLTGAELEQLVSTLRADVMELVREVEEDRKSFANAKGILDALPTIPEAKSGSPDAGK